MIYSTYRILTTLLSSFVLPGLWVYTWLSGRYRENFKERLGCYPLGARRLHQAPPRLWIHAVSLGEVRAAVSIIQVLGRLMPDCFILLSTFTETGRRLAQASVDPGVPVVYAPLDFSLSVRKALISLRPQAMIFLETEIWPNWLFEARRLGIKTALINGRISSKSFQRYLRLRPLFRQVLSRVDRFSMILKQDANRIVTMGADARNVKVNGNAKYDLLAAGADQNAKQEMHEMFNLEPGKPVLVAGSIRKGEMPILLDAYAEILEAFPDMLLVVAPRHLERLPSMMASISARGLDYRLRTQMEWGASKGRGKVILIDTFGELFRIYSIATVVFCGGSLVPLGGQNPLEPAAWAKPVLYGPHMDNFMDAKALLEAAKAGLEVSDAHDLAHKVIWCLQYPGKSSEMGRRGREALLKIRGASERHARVIVDLVQGE